MEAAVRSEHDPGDQELVSLARETRLVADSIGDPAIRDRLIEIANALMDLASPRQLLN